MCSISPDQQHKFHHSHHHLYKKSIDIPPRKQLLDRRSNDLCLDSPKSDDALFSKFLPYNNTDEDDDGSDPYSSDHFRIYEFKVRKCTRSRSHDWTDCPFAHPGEKARRRDPRRFHYSGTVCSEFRKGNCSKGDNCEFSHGVFECWLHPSRYRTEACKDGKNCKRKICFFAHSTRQLRIVPETPSPPLNSPDAEEKSFHPNLNHYCACCHSVLASPTSTLMRSMAHSSPPISPPISTVNSPAAFYGCGENLLAEFHGGGMSYRDALTELMNSMDAMNVNETVISTPMSSSSSGFGSIGKSNLPWVDVNFGVEEQPQFVMSPSTPSPGSSKFSSGSSNSSNSRFARGEYYQFPGRNLMEESRYNNNNNNNNSESNLGGPDLGWVNDLLT